MNTRSCWLCCALLGAAVSLSAAVADKPARPPSPPPPDLAEYRTVASASTTQVARARFSPTGQAGYLGVLAEVRNGLLTVAEVEADSPAVAAGVKPGDVLLTAGGETLKTPADLRGWLQGQAPGEAVKVSVSRAGRKLELSATLGSVSRPLRLAAERGILGLRVAEARDGEGVSISQLTTGMPADKAGLRRGDVILKINDALLAAPNDLTDALAVYGPGDEVRLTVKKGDREAELKLQLVADPNADSYTTPGTPRSLWRKPVYRLGVVLVEYPDQKHNEKQTPAAWHDALFARGTFTKTNATGQAVHGSVYDYFHEQSSGLLRIEGKVFNWLEVSKKRTEYAAGSTSASVKSAYLAEALDLLRAREGNDCLQDFDGLLFIYAGDRIAGSSRGSLYWPHKGNVTYRGKRWAYFICPEGGARMNNISVYCHELGHMLGLPDLYARPENPGSEGLGMWCAMSNQSGNGRPQHFSAWCKEQMGWLTPAVIDPTVKQKLILSPVNGSTNECYKVLVRRDGTEYLLLENRRKTGFDQSLPAEGLLVWRVVQGRPILEESHGVDGAAGPRVFVRSVPYPSAANNALTPYTTPSSRSQLGGGLPVHITNIRQLADGRITFQIGYEFQ